MSGIEAETGNGSHIPRAMFVVSLGAPNQPINHRGFWIQVPAVPDFTIHLKIYVPSLQVRQQGDVYFPCCESWHLSKCILRKAWLLSSLADVVRMCLCIHTLSIGNLKSQELYVVGPHGRVWSQKQINIQTMVNALR